MSHKVIAITDIFDFANQNCNKASNGSFYGQCVMHTKRAASGPECVKLQSRYNPSPCDVIPSKSGFMNGVDAWEVLVSGRN